MSLIFLFLVFNRRNSVLDRLIFKPLCVNQVSAVDREDSILALSKSKLHGVSESINCVSSAYMITLPYATCETKQKRSLPLCATNYHTNRHPAETCTLGLSKISQFWKNVGGGNFSHYLVCSECSGTKINQIKKLLGVANRI